jgi:hypothetical protein
MPYQIDDFPLFKLTLIYLFMLITVVLLRRLRRGRAEEYSGLIFQNRVRIALIFVAVRCEV